MRTENENECNQEKRIVTVKNERMWMLDKEIESGKIDRQTENTLMERECLNHRFRNNQYVQAIRDSLLEAVFPGTKAFIARRTRATVVLLSSLRAGEKPDSSPVGT